MCAPCSARASTRSTLVSLEKYEWCVSHSLTKMICQGSPRDTPEQLANTEGSPVFGAEVAVVRPDGTECDAGEEGEVDMAERARIAGMD